MKNATVQSVIEAITGAFGLSWRREGNVYVFTK